MSTNEDAALGGSDFIGHDASGKHLLLKVPSYEDSPPSGGNTFYQAAKDTYLNLGRGMGDPARNLPEWYVPTAPGATRRWDASGLAEGALTSVSTSGDDLLASFGGFADDQRLRGAGGSFGTPTATPPNEAVARAAASAPFSAVGATAAATAGGRNLQVTATIPDYLGWRDHTDGHRITTTRGDKIEIIGGNYKIVSLGRGQGVAQYEMSGGIIVGGDDAPGSITSVTWRPCPTGASNESGWKVVEQAVKGNVVDRFHGTRREEVFGNLLVSVTGSPDEASTGLAVGAGQAGDPETYVGGTAVTSKKNVAADSWTFESYAYPTKWDPGGGSPPKLQRPAIHESTWAASVTEYTHVTGDYAGQSHFVGKHEERNIYEAGHVSETTMHGGGDYYQEVWHLMGSGGFFERFEGSFLQLFTGSSTTIGFANRFELYVSLEEQLNLGLILSFSLGGKVDGSFPTKFQIDLAEEKVLLNGNEVGLKEVTAHLVAQEARINNVKTCLKDSSLALSTTNTALVTNL